MAQNDISQTTEHFKLNVQARPCILKDLGKNIECYPGDHVNLTVKLEAEPAPEIIWYLLLFLTDNWSQLHTSS